MTVRTMEPPLKRQRKALLSDGSSDEESGDESGGLKLANGNENFKINEDYARRFEHNKKREELQQLEGKLGKTSAFSDKQRSKQGAGGEEVPDESSSESEDEDDEGVLATETLDSEIFATLNAIRSKDPRVYDSKTTFYNSADDAAAQDSTSKQSKPMYLRDYHRERLLSGADGEEAEEADAPPKTYAQEQEDLKQSVVKEMHAAAGEEAGDNEDGDEDGFLVKKQRQEAPPAPAKKITELDIEAADKNPERFLSNFLEARAWVPSKRSNLQPFESDDEEEDARADALEEAYNFRFEDPNKLNQALVTHSRDTTSKFSVRREELSGRKKKREAERQRKEEEKKQLDEERARLRKLKVEELEDKVAKIKHAAGIKASAISDEDWARFLEEGWDDDKWEAEMQKRFGEEYYATGETGEDEDEAGADSPKKKRVKKPQWDDDIDIKDLVPDFEGEENANAGAGESDADQEVEAEDDGESRPPRKKDRLRDKREKQREARKQRQRIEQAVDKNLDVEAAFLPGSSKKYSGHFRYRETSPVNFGLTARDILMADDSHLNQHAGLKKLASFRDAEKKKRDRKRLGKKARLREWRKGTFGTEDGPPMEFPEPRPNVSAEAHPEESGGVDIREGKKKRKRSKKH